MKSDFLNNLKEMDNYTFTENGGVALRSTGNAVLDAFGSLGAMMTSAEEDILTTFYKALRADQALAMKLLFYIRDIRGGQGMRRVFRTIARNLAINNPELIKNNLDNFLFYGRGDDLLCLMETPIEKDVLNFITKTLNEDMKLVGEGKDCSLLAKWMPSENTSSQLSVAMAKKIRNGMGLNSKQYRVMLSTLRKQIGIVESKMSTNDWDIKFSAVPSKASMIYSNAFIKHNEDGYMGYLKDVANGKAKINAGALFPVDIMRNVLNSPWNPSLKDKLLYQAMWEALPNYFEGKEETGICVVDVSGSMFGKPLEVALSLGMYCADKCKGPFKNHFITFSGNPKLQEISGEDIFEKVRGMERAEWQMNTDIKKVFELILNTALANNTPQEDLPSKLYIISDMQFDECARPSGKGGRWSYSNEPAYKPETVIESMRALYAEHGYTVPALVFWNVRASECGMFQLSAKDKNSCAVSGYSASLFEAVINGTEYEEEVNEVTGETIVKQKLDPIAVMTKTLNNERYDRVYTGC